MNSVYVAYINFPREIIFYSAVSITINSIIIIICRNMLWSHNTLTQNDGKKCKSDK